MPMDKKAFMAALTITALLLSLVGVQFVGMSKANPLVNYNGPPFPWIRINSPTTQDIYNSTVVPLDLYLFANEWVLNRSSGKSEYETLLWLNYTLDGVEHSLTDFRVLECSIPFTTDASASIVNLYSGNQPLVVYGQTTYGSNVSTSLVFCVHAPPLIDNVTVENQTYAKIARPMLFHVNEAASWIGMSLDGEGNLTIYGNCTLTGLSEGNHTMTIFCNDTFGNMVKSDTIFFTITLPSATPTPTPTIEPTLAPSPSVPEFPAWIASPVLVAVAAMAAYLAKNKKKD